MIDAHEFDGWLIANNEPRAVMSPPRRYTAARPAVRAVEAAMDECSGDPTLLADWLVNLLERYGARSARPVFFADGEGEGPCCSWCGAWWPMCGHHHYVPEPSGEPLEEVG